MTILNEVPAGDLRPDVCIIGAGPVGIALALECERHGLTVVALEAGGRSEHDFSLDGGTTRANIVDPAHHYPLFVTTRSAFGGTSWAWSGNCVPFDPIDFRERPHVPNSGWPITPRDVEPYYANAARILNCDQLGPENLTDEAYASCPLSTAQFSLRPKLALTYRGCIERSRKITVCLNSPVVSVELSDAGDCVNSVVVAAHEGRRSLHARHVVIAAGGLRSTQLLLQTQRRWPRHFGGVDGPLGRYYMGHLAGWISAIQFANSDDAVRFAPLTNGNRTHAQKRFGISEALQHSKNLLNTAFWPSNVSLFDPSHCSGLLSAAFLALAMPGIGRWMMPVSQRTASLGPQPRRFGSHLRNIVNEPHSTVVNASRALWGRVAHGNGLGDFFQATNKGSFLLYYHAEHAPNPSSRVCLTDRTDDLGLPVMRVDLRYSEGDVESVVKSHRALDESLRVSSQGQLNYLVQDDELAARVLEQAKDGYHQIGTTRMGSSSRTSVVDSDCQVHDVRNLHVASSSVFPTSSQANPTLLATALAVRLAENIAKKSTISNAVSAASVASIGEGLAALLSPHTRRRCPAAGQ